MGRERKIWVELLSQAIAVGGLLICLKLGLKYIDPYREQREAAKKRSQFLRQQLGRSLDLNEYEQLLAAQVLNPENVGVSLADVSGLDHIIQDMELKVLCPMAQPDVYRTTLFRPARGVLLYGPPGTGKTMLAKAMAAQSGCFFLNLTASSIMSKWLGDANKLVRAVFSLAEKLQPCIIFIDEVDAILGKRGGSSEHEASLQVKTEFMQLWDGMETTSSQRVVVMGATNRPQMVDEAVLRRFTIQYEVGLPNEAQRVAILTSYIHKHYQEMGDRGVDDALLENLPPIDAPAGAPGAVDWLAQRTAGYSGSDLMELCSQAAQRVLAEFWALSQTSRTGQRQPGSKTPAQEVGEGALRSVRLDDFEAVLRFVRPAQVKAEEYAKGVAAADSGGFNFLDMMQMMLAAKGGGAAGGAAANGNGGKAPHTPPPGRSEGNGKAAGAADSDGVNGLE